MPKSKLRSLVEGFGSILVIDPGPAPTMEQVRREMAARQRALLIRCRPPVAPAAEDPDKSLKDLARRGEVEAHRLAEGDPRLAPGNGPGGPRPIAVVERFLRIKKLLRLKPFSDKPPFANP